jgi:hypothetical protein
MKKKATKTVGKKVIRKKPNGVTRKIPKVVRKTLKIVEMETKTLVPYAKNAKLHGKKQVDQIVASMNEFGFTNPVLVDAHGGIIAGHGRVMAAKRLGMATVPCIELAHLTPEQKKAYILADNRLAETGGGWDKAVGLEELGDIDTPDGILSSMFAELAEELELLPGVGDESGESTTPQVIEEMELQPEEHYDFLVVMATNVNDWNTLCAHLNVKEVHSTRTAKRIGVGRAVHASTVLNLINKNKK